MTKTHEDKVLCAIHSVIQKWSKLKLLCTKIHKVALFGSPHQTL